MTTETITAVREIEGFLTVACPDCYERVDVPEADVHPGHWHCPSCGFRNLLEVPERQPVTMDALVAQKLCFERDRQLMNGKLHVYRDLLIENGIPIPADEDVARMYAESKAVVKAAADLIEAADRLKASYGTAMELVRGGEWR